jgi:hypothetical protein
VVLRYGQAIHLGRRPSPRVARTSTGAGSLIVYLSRDVSGAAEGCLRNATAGNISKDATLLRGQWVALSEANCLLGSGSADLGNGCADIFS